MANRMEPLGPTIERYIEAILGALPGPKVLLLDREVTNIVSAAYSQASLLRHEVFLTQPLSSAERPVVPHFGCVVICRPTSDAIGDITAELNARRYKDYHIIFTNMVDTDLLQMLVNGDPYRLISKVEEVFLDISPVTDETVVIPIGSSAFGLKARAPMVMSQWENADFSRVVQGLVAFMLASNRRPAIRFRNGSKVATRIATDLGAKMRTVNTSFFDLRSKECVLLILDRCDDPVTPLLTQWTYEAMVHEFIGVDAGKVGIDSGETVEERTQVLDTKHDHFFAAHRYSDWGHLCTAVKDLIEAYKSLNSIQLETASITDIREFVEKFPDAKHQSVLVTRHATIVGQLGEEVKGRRLVQISTLEQELACTNAINEHTKMLMDAIEDPGLDGDDLLRLTLLYELRYEGKSGNQTGEMKRRLVARGVAFDKVALIDRMSVYAGAAARTGALYSRQPGFFKEMAKAITGFREDEVQNVLTQHTPTLKRIILQAYNGCLPEAEYPYFQATQGTMTEATPVKDVLVFMCGGATYEEAALVNQFNYGAVENDPQMEQLSALAAANAGAAAAGAAGQGERTGTREMLSGMASKLVGGAGAGSQGAGGDLGAGAASPPPAEEKKERKPVDVRVALASTAMLSTKRFMEAIA